MKRIILPTLILLLSAFLAGAAELRFHTMPETGYYGGIHSIAKDSLGRIWFSGFDAVYMYNGDSFTRMNDALTVQEPESYWNMGWLVTDRENRLYLATNHGLQRFDCRRSAFEISRR